MKKKINEIIKHPLFSGSLIMIIGSNFANFLNLLYHPILGKMLGPSNYGEMVAIISLMGFLAIVPASLTLVVVKYVSAAQNNTEISAITNWLKTKTLLASSIFSFLILVLSPVILSFLHINKFYYLLLVILSFLFSSQSLLNRSVLQGLLKFKEMIISILVENGSKLLIGILLVYFGFQVGGAIAGFTLSSILGWYLTKFYLRHQEKKTNTRANFKQIVAYIGPVLIQSFATTSLYSSDVILVKHFFHSYEAGLYAALSTLGKIIFFGASPISAVMFPLVSHRYARGGEYKRVFIYSLFATLLLAVFVLVIYWLVPGFIITALYGTSYVSIADLLIWFGIFITLFTLSLLLINFHLSLGHTKVVLMPVVAAILQIVAIWFYHNSLLTVIIISILATALLLASLLIYSSYAKRPSGDQIDISNSPDL